MISFLKETFPLRETENDIIIHCPSAMITGQCNKLYVSACIHRDYAVYIHVYIHIFMHT